MTRKNKQKTLSINPELYSKLEKEAKKQQRSMSNLIVQILSERMEDN